MKLAYFLAQYLYTYKRLDLPGIGTFLLDPSVVIEAENSKHRSSVPEGITFENNPSLKNAQELINYISEKSGKMKPLASADLESHLQLAQQFLNMSKPFTFEGIGTLVRLKAGEFEFTPGTINVDKLKELSGKEVHGVAKKGTVEAKYQAYLSTPVSKSGFRKPVITLLILIGIGLTIWGGYTISQRNGEKEDDVTVLETNASNAINTVDSSQLKPQVPDTAQEIKKQEPDSYKYVFEVTKANKALKRYKQLMDTKLSGVVQLETKDSIQFKLFALLPVTRDTTRVIDSLTEFLGKKVYIERQN